MTQPTRGFGVVVYRPRSASASARAMCCASCGVNGIELLHAGSALARLLDLLDGLAEVVDALEVLVHRGEADVGDVVHFLQLAHHHLADDAAGHLALAQRDDALL